MKHQQLDLFASSSKPPILPSSSSNLLLSKNSLTDWKQKLSEYQQDIREQNLHQQQTLFNVEQSMIDCGNHSFDRFNPFTSKLYPMSFHDFAKGEPGDACIYFVLDNAANLVLCIGETKADWLSRNRREGHWVCQKGQSFHFRSTQDKQKKWGGEIPLH